LRLDASVFPGLLLFRLPVALLTHYQLFNFIAYFDSPPVPRFAENASRHGLPDDISSFFATF